jgi:Fe-S-cluster containining protein
MLAESKFSYVCNRCGLCCRDKVITLSPYDVIRIARAAKVSTGTAVARYTLRRGSLLRFLPDGRCAALDGPRCTIHPGRPLACRLYPLGLGCGRPSAEETAVAHVAALGEMAASERDGAIIAAAAVMLATSLGYAPSKVARARATP